MGEVEGWREEGRRERERRERREEEREVGREGSRKREKKREKKGRKKGILLESREVHSRRGARVRTRGRVQPHSTAPQGHHAQHKALLCFIKVTLNSLRFYQGVPVEEEEEGNKLQVLLKHIESPFVQSNPAVREGLMHIIPFLTFGDPKNMNILLQHFAPYLNFEK